MPIRFLPSTGVSFKLGGVFLTEQCSNTSVWTTLFRWQDTIVSTLEFTSRDVIVLVIDISVEVILCSLALTEFKAHVGVCVLREPIPQFQKQRTQVRKQLCLHLKERLKKHECHKYTLGDALVTVICVLFTCFFQHVFFWTTSTGGKKVPTNYKHNNNRWFPAAILKSGPFRQLSLGREMAEPGDASKGLQGIFLGRRQKEGFQRIGFWRHQVASNMWFG